ncbi:MAG: hypothetical protein WC306_02385 [Candidatus Paceibacterota bacterium]|jgi:hypothetical protein
MKKILLVLAVLVVGLALMTGCGNVPPIEPDSDFVGSWININQVDPNVTKCVIVLAGSNLSIDIWAACVPTDCYWGSVLVEKTDSIDGTMEIYWIWSFGEKTQNLTLVDSNQLEIKTFFHSFDSNLEYTTIEYFIKE